MYQIILIYLLMHHVSCFINDFNQNNQNLNSKNSQIINNLFLNSPAIKSNLIDVTEQKSPSDYEKFLINKFIKENNLPKARLINDFNLITKQNNQIDKINQFNDQFNNQFNDQLNDSKKLIKHTISKRENNNFFENDDQSESSLEDELERIKSEFDPFVITRSPQLIDVNNKALIREYIIAKFNSFKMKTYKQTFQSQLKSISTNFRKGVNIFSIYPSQLRKKALRENSKVLNDRIIVLGAHYDTVNNSYGIDDNSSGVVNLFEIARLLNRNRIRLNYTIFFVCFDYEELGLHGSKAFVDKYLIPTEIIENQSQFIGAFITDMLLNYNNNENTQTLPSDIKLKVPKINTISESNKHRGNYIALWSRKNIDNELVNKLTETWKQSKDSDRYKLFNMNPRLPVTIKHNSKSIDLGCTFIRSDHANFWYPKVRNFDKTLNAVLLTDLGPWRSEFNVCYHRSCDDEKQLTKSNLEFFLHTTKILYKMLTENPPTLIDNSLSSRNQAINYSTRKSVSRRLPRFRNIFILDN